MTKVRLARITQHYQTLLKLQTQRISGEFCDVTLQVEDEEFSAHRGVLAASSDYFMKMFTIDMKEKSSETIAIESVTAEAMEIVLTSIYTGDVALSEEHIGEVLHAASLMQLTSLVKVYKSFMHDTLSASNCCLFYELAKLYTFDDVKLEVCQVLLQRFDEICGQPRLLKIDFDFIYKVLSCDDLVVENEITVFNFVKNWVNYDLEDREELFPILFSLVRLHSVPVKDIVKLIRENELIQGGSACRNLVEEAMSYHLHPEGFTEQNHRKCFISKPDAILILRRESIFQQIFDCNTNSFFLPDASPPLYGLSEQMVLEDCPVATQYPKSVFCGGIQNFDSSKQAVCFNGIRWVNLPPMNEARCGAAAVFFDGDVLVFGGEASRISADVNFSHCNPSFACSNEKFDGTSWEVFSSDVISGRSYWAAQQVKEKIYFMGGYKMNPSRSFSEKCKIICRDTNIYCSKSNTWKVGPDMHEPRASFACAVLHSQIFVAGGTGKDDDFYVAESLNVADCGKNWSNVRADDRLYQTFANFACVSNQRLYVFTRKSSRLFALNGKDNRFVDIKRQSAINQSDIVAVIPIFKKLITDSILMFDS